MALVTAGLVLGTAAFAQGNRDNPEQVLKEEFGWTIKDLTRMSTDRAGLFSPRKEPYQGFNCVANARYLPKTEEQKSGWRFSHSVCRTSDRWRNENIGAFLELGWASLSVEKPETTNDFIEARGKGMAGTSAKEGFSYRIVESKTVENIRIDLVEYFLPFSNRPFYGAAASFEHRGYRYVLIAANALSANAITKKPWEVIDEIAQRIVFFDGP